jgi:hypothetical protein
MDGTVRECPDAPHPVPQTDGHRRLWGMDCWAGSTAATIVDESHASPRHGPTPSGAVFCLLFYRHQKSKAAPGAATPGFCLSISLGRRNKTGGSRPARRVTFLARPRKVTKRARAAAGMGSRPSDAADWAAAQGAGRTSSVAPSAQGSGRSGSFLSGANAGAAWKGKDATRPPFPWESLQGAEGVGWTLVWRRAGRGAARPAGADQTVVRGIRPGPGATPGPPGRGSGAAAW